jgi:uncharacterized protein (TIGR03435 family)
MTRRGLLRLATGLAQVSKAPSKDLKFEVISIRPHAAGNESVRTGPTADGFRSIGLPLFAIFQWAYALPNQRGLLRADRIEGDPGWLTSEPYDVVAKVDVADVADWQNPAMRQTMLRAMLQQMLAERCKVVTHYGSKEAPVYDLMIAKGGPKFRKAETVDAGELRRKHPDAGTMRGSGTLAAQGPDATQFYAIPMATLADTVLSSIAERPVVDKTGLSGFYDLALPPTARGDDSIFAAVEALGLRLKPAKGYVETLVIDHVEIPSGN